MSAVYPEYGLAPNTLAVRLLCSFSQIVVTAVSFPECCGPDEILSKNINFQPERGLPRHSTIPTATTPANHSSPQHETTRLSCAENRMSRVLVSLETIF